MLYYFQTSLLSRHHENLDMKNMRGVIIAVALMILAGIVIGILIYQSGIARCAGQQTIEIGHMRVAGCP